ncbi:MAG: peptidylprolyl isomerase [Prevotella sp.]|nr:peptidylprolyl isomerase [Prevotella sp.]
MKKIVSMVALLLSAGMAMAQANDPVIMTVNGKPVLKSEFEYSYNKNNSEGVIDKKTVREYVDLFINYKLKVEAALDAKLDTMKSFQDEFKMYRDQQIRPSFVTDDDMEAEAKKVYQNTKDQIGPNGLVMPAHILIQVNQKAEEAEKLKAKERIDSIYGALKAGADFAEMATKFSQDPGSARKGGVLPWIGPNQTVKEFDDVAYSLQVGQMSEPFESPFGYHIILMKDRKQLEPYDSLRTNIMKFLEARNARDHVAKTIIDSVAKQRGITTAELMDERTEQLCANDIELKNLVREYHDGLLLFEISNQTIWDKAAKDSLALANYFKKNKKKYKWDEPRYKGMVFHVKVPEDVEAVKKSVKGLPFEKWAERLRTTFNNDSVIRIRVEKGIFKRGDNAYIDKLVFHKDTTTRQVKNYPIDDVYGKLIKKPENFEDVRGQVTADYQDMLEKQWVAELRKKYAVKVDEAVLATVKEQ